MPVVRNDSVTCRPARGSIRDAARQGSVWLGRHTTLRGDGTNWEPGGRGYRPADREYRDPACGPHLFDRDRRCPRKADVASLIRDCDTPNRSAAVDRSGCADRFRLPAAAGYGRRDLGSAASNCSLQRAGYQAAAN